MVPIFGRQCGECWRRARRAALPSRTARRGLGSIAPHVVAKIHTVDHGGAADELLDMDRANGSAAELGVAEDGGKWNRPQPNLGSFDMRQDLGRFCAMDIPPERTVQDAGGSPVNGRARISHFSADSTFTSAPGRY
ncbi:MAG: hypothetical protein WDO73_02125 [Ignavibacteriota bacterium]